MEQSLAAVQRSLADLSAALPDLPDDVRGWIGVYGGLTASIHVPAASPPADFDRVVLAVVSVHGPGDELDDADAGYLPGLRQFVLRERVAGWHLTVVTRADA